MKRNILALLIVIGIWAGWSSATAQAASGRGPVIATGAQRQQIAATPILQRPYRPLHFYGNTVRRRHYSGRAVPASGDLTQGASSVVRRN
jgi:hypothetical protein